MALSCFCISNFLSSSNRNHLAASKYTLKPVIAASCSVEFFYNQSRNFFLSSAEFLSYCSIDIDKTHHAQHVVIITQCTVTVSMVYGFTVPK